MCEQLSKNCDTLYSIDFNREYIEGSSVGLELYSCVSKLIYTMSN